MATAIALNGTQKAALLLIQLGKDHAARVMAQLDEAEIEALTTEIARLERVDTVVADGVLEEFYDASMGGSSTAPGRGGMGLAQHLLEASVGRERAAGMLERLASSMAGQPFDFLQYADARQVVSLLNGEHPQTIALVLAHLRAEHASAILAGLAPTAQADVAHRIALMERASPDVVAVVAQNLQHKASAVLTPQEMSAVGGVQPLVEIINRADPTTEKLILEGLEARDQALADEVRSRMFVFTDIVLLEDRAIQLILRGVEMSSLATALKGAGDDAKDKILRNLSERAAVVQVIRRLEESGQITIRREGDDEYVA